MANPFTSVQCSVRADNARVLSWTLMSNANYPSDFILSVLNSRSGGPWLVLTSDVGNTCVFIDSRKRNYNKYLNLTYRLRITSASTGLNYVSEPIHAGYSEVYPFSTEAKNVITQASKAIKLSGVLGVLLKRKHWGLRCPDCTDFNGQGSVNQHCHTCLGTGIVGGYYNGISLNMIIDQITNAEATGQTGYIQSKTLKARCIAYPWISKGDLWCHTATNERYVIANALESSTYKHIPLIYTLLLHKMLLTDVAYSSVATAKVTNKDIWKQATVEYTTQTETQKLTEAVSAWKAALSTP